MDKIILVFFVINIHDPGLIKLLLKIWFLQEFLYKSRAQEIKLFIYKVMHITPLRNRLKMTTQNI